MSFVPNKRRRSNAYIAATQPAGYPGWPPLDTLYDYTAILNTTAPIANVPNPQPVAVIGAGPAGLAAAFELMRMGVPVTVLEGNDRIGGRNFTDPFPLSTTHAIGEMGAMRVPPSARVFMYYVDQFNIQTTTFPDPGTVPTTLYYEDSGQQWNFGLPPSEYPTSDVPTPPGEFEQIHTDWDNFITPFIDELNTAWGLGLEAVQQLWQSYIDKYANISFYQALFQSGLNWTPEDFNAFGALGVGSGGFGPLYQISFLEMLRIILNQWETDQALILGLPNNNPPLYGIDALTMSFYTTQVQQPGGASVSLQSLNAVNLNATVQSISYDASLGMPAVQWTDGSGLTSSKPFSAVIVATTTRSMQVMGLTLPTVGIQPQSLLGSEVMVALRDLNLVNSSKLFVRTPSKFWVNNSNISWNIQTDEMIRGLYTLDYPWTTDGVVLISYVWCGDSEKLLAIPPVQRYGLFWNIINNIDSVFASNLPSPENVNPEDILNIDWEATTNFYGAFKLNYPGQDPELAAAYYQFQSAQQAVYLAGDSVSWSGGWTEGALETGINAACAVVNAWPGTTFPNGSPMRQNPNLYNYVVI